VTIHARLRIATRIHFALLRHLGEGIDVGTMLKNDAEAREVLWVCDATQDAELNALANQYRRALVLENESLQMPAAGHAMQDTAWAKDSSGFGLSQLPGSQSPHVPATHRAPPQEKAPATRRWLAAMGWNRRGVHTAR